MAEWIVELGDGNIHIKKMSPIVRCKDCKSWNRYDDVQVIGSCKRHGDNYNKRGTDFCSWGERKNG